MEKAVETLMIPARDGTQLACHRYRVPVSDDAHCSGRVLLLHGSTFNSRRYANIAKACVKSGFEVVLCDWRGHGESQGKPGTCDYIGQLEDDISDIIAWFEQEQPLPLILGGHSAGSVVCLRYLEKYGQKKVDACYFIAPTFNNTQEPLRFDKPGAQKSFLLRHMRKKPCFQPAPESAAKHMPVMNDRMFYLATVLPFLRHRTVITFPGSEKMAALEGRVLNYSFNLMASVSIPYYSKAFRKLKLPVVFICGENDEGLHPDFLPMLCQWHLAPQLDKEVVMLPKLNHMSVLGGAARVLPQWLMQRWGENKGAVEQQLRPQSMQQAVEQAS
ncbi:alpha/beta hydrolase [Thalassomonas actiniarum]|uniref:Alpha/beta hydrolase n=1 Tax=Thalassomonas actiniarum TaxID=485447 RepID=A0AAE9YW85_9GAMM|nr:alpha/beta hydrolase [Thalassomonas actiniarum]WDE02320.1 alpha/beta hydrolase [Thalassomonas actiniarum]